MNPPYSVSDLPRTLPRKIKVNDETGCWEWLGTMYPTGYGAIRFADRLWRAHRLIYTLLVEPIPTGLVLDHLCRVKHCVNPSHLDAVPQYENVRRGLKCAGQKVGATDNALAAVLRDELTARGWTQADFATKTGHAPAIIRTRLSGSSTFLIPEVFDYAAALDIPASVLMGRAESAVA